MINTVIQCALFALVGVVVGVFGALLFFRLDKGWKQILLGVGSLFSVGGIGRVIISYLKVPEENISLMFLILIITTIISVWLAFKTMCTLLKEEKGRNRIRVLDIVLGYEGFLKNYYETRNRDNSIADELEGIEQREIALENKKKYLTELKKGIDEQKSGALILQLPENSEYALTNHFVKQIPLYVDHICQFKNNVDKLTNDFCGKLRENDIDKKECLKGYFAGIGMYVANDLFGTSNADVRTHFRILKDDKYIVYTVVLGDKISNDKISDIPKGQYMIEKSFRLKKYVCIHI